MSQITRLQPDHAATAVRAAEFQPATFREADNSVEVVWTTGAAVTRYDWGSGYFDETLSTDAVAVRLERLNDGGPVLIDHRGSVSALVGSIEPGSAKLEAGKGTARIRLTSSPDMADVVAKVREGHLRTVSVGYRIHAYEWIEREGEARSRMHATDWEPLEISLVTVPADPGAIIRSGSNAMPEFHQPTDDDTQARQQPRRRGAVTEDRIRDLCSRSDDLPRSFERRLLEMHREEPLSERELQRALEEELVSIRQTPHIDTRAGGGGEVDLLRGRMEDALYARMSGREPVERAREFMGVRLLDMARGMMEARGERVRWASPNQIVERMGGAHTTSDFPLILGNATRRYLLDVLRAYPSPLKVLAKRRTAVDFRDIVVNRMSGNPQLLLVKELAEFPQGSVVEAGEQYKLNTYGRIFAISRQALINDDLGAFSGVFSSWGRSAGELEATYLAGLIQGNGPTMADGSDLYSVAHGNLAGAGAAISVASLSAARQAMRSQRDLDGVTPLNIAPKYLVVGAAKETEAEQVLATLNATQTSEVNPFSGKLELLVDSRLGGSSWRLFADPSAWPVLEVARLEGQEDVYVETQAGFEIDGVKTKARVDIGAAAIDWRGTYMNPGA